MGSVVAAATVHDCEVPQLSEASHSVFRAVRMSGILKTHLY